MPKYVAFLRAINVGGGHVVKMDQLIQLFEALGFSNVETFIASGNVIFDSTSKSTKTLERKIESLLQETLGYAVATFVRSTSELANIAEYKPFDDSDLNADGTALYIAFTSDEPSTESKRKLTTFTTEVDDPKVEGRELGHAAGGALIRLLLGVVAHLAVSISDGSLDLLLDALWVFHQPYRARRVG